MIAAGNIVILENESTLRIFWKLAEVEELIPSCDKIVRSAKIRVLNEINKKIVYLRRPIQHLISLEINRESVKGNMKKKRSIVQSNYECLYTIFYSKMCESINPREWFYLEYFFYYPQSAVRVVIRSPHSQCVVNIVLSKY